VRLEQFSKQERTDRKICDGKTILRIRRNCMASVSDPFRQAEESDAEGNPLFLGSTIQTALRQSPVCIGTSRAGSLECHATHLCSAGHRLQGAVALNWGWGTNAIFGHVDPHPHVDSAFAGPYGQVLSSKVCEAHFRCSEYADYRGAFFITSRRF